MGKRVKRVKVKSKPAGKTRKGKMPKRSVNAFKNHDLFTLSGGARRKRGI